MIAALQPDLSGADSSFWVSYQEAIKYFSGVDICKVRNWDEVRIKGKFVRV